MNAAWSPKTCHALKAERYIMISILSILYVSIFIHQTPKNKNHIKMIAQRRPKCVIVHQHQKEFCQSLKWTCWFRSANIAAAHCRLRVLLQAPAALAAQMRTAFRSSNAEREGAEKHSLPADPPGNICKRNRAPQNQQNVRFLEWTFEKNPNSSSTACAGECLAAGALNQHFLSSYSSSLNSSFASMAGGLWWQVCFNALRSGEVQLQGDQPPRWNISSSRWWSARSWGGLQFPGGPRADFDGCLFPISCKVRPIGMVSCIKLLHQQTHDVLLWTCSSKLGSINLSMILIEVLCIWVSWFEDLDPHMPSAWSTYDLVCMQDTFWMSGLSLFEDVPLTATEFEQYKARVDRANSHEGLPPDERVVNVRVACASVEFHGVRSFWSM